MLNEDETHSQGWKQRPKLTLEGLKQKYIKPNYRTKRGGLCFSADYEKRSTLSADLHTEDSYRM